MAIQNDNTLVTKGDLKELYTDKIAPYLGGGISYYHTDRTGEELKSCYASLGSAWPATANTNVPFIKRTGEFIQPSTGLFTIPNGTKIEVVYTFGGNPGGDSTFGLYNNTDSLWITADGADLKMIDPFIQSGYNYGSVLQVIWKNETGHDVDVAIRCNGTAQSTTLAVDRNALTIKEIGRIVDPVKYVSNNSDLQETPVGNIISYMGNSVPKHYLACDGATYSVGTYPELEAFIIEEFGSINYFGGDGSSTWAVPDLRGEFLRGTGTNGHTNQGNGGNVGEHQNATEIPTIGLNQSGIIFGNAVNKTTYFTGSNKDSSIKGRAGYSSGGTYTASASADSDYKYMVRPTSTSVKYCIKYESTFHAFFSNAAYKVEGSFDLIYDSTGKKYDISSITYAVGDSSLISGAYFIVPMDGWYVVSFKSSQVTYTNPAVQYLSVVSSRGNYSLTNGTGSGTGHSHFGIEASDVLYLTKGDKVTYQVWTNGGTIPTPTTKKATFCLLESNYNPTIVSADSIYSENEQMIGYWKDGKPLYQKAIHFGYSLTDTTVQQEWYEPVGASVDTVVKVWGQMSDAAKDWSANIPYSYDDQYILVGATNNTFSDASKRNKAGLLWKGNLSWATDLYVTVQYTKTTDTASSLQIENSLLLNRPDLWEVGTEYHFGGGLYGIRKTGTFSRSAGERIDITIVSSLATTARPINTGGWIKFPDGWEISIPGNWTQGIAATDIQFVSPAWHQNDKIFISTVTPHTGTYTYDFWVTYKK